MISERTLKSFRDIRDIIFDLSDEAWSDLNSHLLYKHTRLGLAIVCSSIVKTASSHVIESILPTLIDSVGILPVVRAEVKLRENSAQNPTSSQRSPEELVCNIIKGVVANIKEAMTRTLVKFSLGETPSESPTPKCVKNNASVIEAIGSMTTISLVSEMVRLCYPEISDQITIGKEAQHGERVQHTIRNIMKAMEHIDNVHSHPTASEVLEDSSDEKSTGSAGRVKSFFSEQFMTNVAHSVSFILREAGESLASAWSPYSNNGSNTCTLDEVTINKYWIRLWPIALKITKTFMNDLIKEPRPDSSKLIYPRNRFFFAAGKTFIRVHKEVFIFLLKVQALTGPEENSGVKAVDEPLVDIALRSGDVSSSGLSPEYVALSVRNVMESGRTCVYNEEQLRIDTCTDEVIRIILDEYRKYGQSQNCNQMVRDALVKNVQMLQMGKKRKKYKKTVRKLSRDTIAYLESAARNLSQSLFSEIQKCVKAQPEDETQTRFIHVCSKSVLDYSELFAPFQLFSDVRSEIRTIFSTVMTSRQLNKPGENKKTFDSITEITVGDNGTIVEKSSLDEGEGFSRGFAHSQCQTVKLALNQLKRVLCSDSATQHHNQIITNTTSTVLRMMISPTEAGRRFPDLVLMRMSPLNQEDMVFGISSFMHSFVLDFIQHVVQFLSCPESGFYQMADQSGWLTLSEGEPKPHPVDTMVSAVSDLEESLKHLIVRPTDKSATLKDQTPSGQYTDELNPDNLESPGKKKKKIRFTVYCGFGKKASQNPKKSKKLKKKSCAVEQDEVEHFSELNRNKNSSGETGGSLLHRNFVGFFSFMKEKLSGPVRPGSEARR